MIRTCAAAIARWAPLAALIAIAGVAKLVAQPVPVDQAFDVNQFTTSFQSQPSVRMASSGAAAFSWESAGQDGSESGVVVRKMAPNGSLFNEFLVNQTIAGEQDFPNLAMNASGDFALTWRIGPNTGRDVAFRSSFNNGSSLANESQANTVAGNMLDSALCRFADDTTVVAWSNTTLRFRRFAANGAPLTTESDFAAISDLDSVGVACLSDGKFVAIFRQDDSDGSGVFARLFDDQGLPVGVTFRVNEDEAASQFNPIVASDGVSRFVVAWAEQPTPQSRLELRRYFVAPGPDELPPVALAGDQLAIETDSSNINIGNIDMASDGAFVLSFDLGGGVNAARALEYTRTGAVLPGGPTLPAADGVATSSVDAGVGLREYLLAWEEPGISTDIRARRYVRRAVFSDDFEVGDNDSWSTVAP